MSEVSIKEIVEDARDFRKDQFYEERFEQIDNTFSDHEATHEIGEVGEDEVHRLVWRRPDTITYLIRYELTNGRMTVTGDMQPAIYVFGHDDLKAIGSYHIGYFGEKIRASPSGRYGKSWNGSVGRASLISSLVDRVNDDIYWGEIQGDKDDEDLLIEKVTERLRKVDDAGGLRAIEDKAEWTIWVRENNGLLSKLSLSPRECAGFGEVWDTSVLYHLRGLKKAAEELNSQ